jgi:two-component system sensor histidine kinase RegB
MTTHQRHALWLWWLRWVMLLLEGSVALVAVHWFGLPLPMAPLGWLLFLQCVFNLVLGVLLARKVPMDDRGLFMQLSADMLFLAVLLYFTGGASNPFASLFIVQVMVAATLLPAMQAWLLAGVSIGLYTLLMVCKQNVDYLQHHHLGEAFSLHIYGMWLSFMILALVIAGMVGRMARTIRKQQEALTEAHALALADEQVVMLGALAAGTAHELGTPINTAMLLAEQAQAVIRQAPARQKLEKLVIQLERAAAVIHRLGATAGGQVQWQGGETTLATLIEMALAQWRNLRPQSGLGVALEAIEEVRISHDPMLVQILVTFLNNAADAGAVHARLEALVEDETLLCIRITDDGAGVPAGFAIGFGASSKTGGRGIGLWLAERYARRMGGELLLVPAAGQGSVATIRIPLHRGEGHG